MTQLQLFSYLYGLMGTDGHACRSGRDRLGPTFSSLSLEVGIVDKENILKLSNMFPKEDSIVRERERDTNFKLNYQSVIWNLKNKDFIKFLLDNDFPMEDKTNTIHKPTKYYDEDYFWLGVIDGDGSLGMKADGHPFINLTTKSEELKNNFIDYVETITGFRSKVNRNKRDGIYNITYGSKKAIDICNRLYANEDMINLGLNRKYQKYLELKDWKPISRKGKPAPLPWTEEEEEDLLIMTNNEFLLAHPNRTLVAIKGKKQRMRAEGRM